MNPRTQANLLFLLGLPFMTFGVFIGRTLGFPYWSDPIFMFIGLVFFYFGYRILKRAQKSGAIPTVPPSVIEKQFLFVVIPSLAFVCFAGPFLAPYLDPTMKLSLKARLLCGLIAFPVSVSAFWFGIRMSQRK
jgi:hypothetical protein